MIMVYLLLIVAGIFAVLHGIYHHKLVKHCKKHNHALLKQIESNPLSNLYRFQIKNEKDPIARRYKVLMLIFSIGVIITLLWVTVILQR